MHVKMCRWNLGMGIPRWGRRTPWSDGKIAVRAAESSETVGADPCATWVLRMIPASRGATHCLRALQFPQWGHRRTALQELAFSKAALAKISF